MPFVHDSHAETREDGNLEPIAICGMGCRLPGAVDSASSLWEMLVKKQSGQTPKVPPSRFNIDAHFHQTLERPGSFNVLGGYFLDQPVENFDPTFFGMTPVEAMWLDPQQRKMLEVCYEALEAAGMTLDSVAGSNCAVFVGSFTADYQQMSTKEADFRHSYAATGVDPGLISNRIGNMFNLNGPSFTINTACSSSVYATHMACHSLRARDCDAALVGGVNLILTVDQHMNTAKLGILSPTSTCHTFDASADGYGRAEGAGALYLKRLSDAIRDGNPVRGVIRSSAVNTNGKVPGMGITHPSGKGQERAVRQAYERAKLDPNKTAYFECHGTGTPVGDPIEVQAVAKAMNDTRSRDKPLLLGAIKPNIGHSEAASGIFAIMKAAMMTEAGVIPGVCGLKNINPAIHEKEWNVKVQADTVPWPRGFRSKRASVSSFGYGGTNGHVIVEDVTASYPFYLHGKPKSEAPYNHSAQRPFLVGFSAHDKTTLARNITAHAKVADKFYLADLAHTLNLKRTRFSTRAFGVVREGSEAEDLSDENIKSGVVPKQKGEVGFIFTGQGAQWARMGAQAIQDFPHFRSTIQALDRVLQSCPYPPSWSLEEELLAPAEKSRVGNAEIAQPALSAIQIAIVDLFASWNISSSVSVGHSSGEIGAAYAAGLISAPEAILAGYIRGLALSRHAPQGGTMLAIGLGVEEALQKIPGLGQDPVAACENSPNSVTLSGSTDAIHRTKALLDGEGIFARELRTGMAYHSPYMQPVAAPFIEMLSRCYGNLTIESLDWRQPLTRMISSVTTEEVTEDDMGPEYWAANLVSPVKFDGAVKNLGNMSDLDDVRIMIEIGPHSALAGPFKQIRKAYGLDRLTYIASLIRGADSSVSLLKTAGELFLQDYEVDLEQVNAAERVTETGPFPKAIKPLTLVDLPPYQWNYERTYWAEPRLSAEQRNLTHPRHDILGSRLLGLSERSPAWRNFLRHGDLPWLKDHKLGGSAIFPAAGHLSLAIEALRQVSENKGLDVAAITVRDVNISTALVIPESNDGIETQVRLTEESGSWHSFAVESFAHGSWTVHCEGKIKAAHNASSDGASPVDRSKLTQRVPPVRWYDAFRRVGFEYGPSFQKLGPIRTNNKFQWAAADVHISTTSGVVPGESRYLLHPATVDACLQLIIISIHAGLHQEMPWGVVPIGIEEATIYGVPDEEALGSAVAWTDESDGRYFNTHTKLAGPDNNIVLDVKGLRCVAYEAAIPPSMSAGAPRQPYAGVSWKPDVTALSEDQAVLALKGIESESDAIIRFIELTHHKTPLSTLLFLGLPQAGTVERALEVIPESTKVTVLQTPEEQETFGERVTIGAIGTDKQLDLASIISGTQDMVVVSKAFMQQLAFGNVIDGLKAITSETSSLTFSIEQGFRKEADEILISSGYKGSNLSVEVNNSLVVLSAPGGDVPREVDNVTLLTMATQIPRLNELQSSLAKICPTNIKSLEDFDEKTDANVIIVDLDGKLLDSLTSETFDALRNLLISEKPVLWLTAGVNEGSNVPGGMAQGFLRTVRSEQAKATITLLDVDESEDIEEIASSAFDMLRKVGTKDSGVDTEYWLHNKVPHISRIIPNDGLNARFDSESEPLTEATLPTGKALHGSFVNGKLVFSEDSHLIGAPLEQSEVTAQVSRIVFESHPAQPSTAPTLMIGSLIKTGESVKSLSPGDSVLAYVQPSLSTVVKLPETQCIKHNFAESNLADISKLVKALNSIGYDGVTASKQHVVLVAPEVAEAEYALKLSRVLGFKLSVISAAEAQTGPSAAAFMSKILQETAQGHKIKVIAYDFSETSQRIWRAMPALGHFVLNENPVTEAPDVSPFTRGATFTTASLSTLHKQDGDALAQLLETATKLIQQHPELLTENYQSVSVDAIDSATPVPFIAEYKYDTSLVMIKPSGKVLQLHPDASYLLVGCLGGLGRSLTTMMMEKGAKHFAFVSRSGADKPEAAHLVRSLKDEGAHVQVFRADASNAAEMAKVVAEVNATRPIRGVVHAAMVLQDGLFSESMTFEKFQAAITPKVQGARSLHEALRGQQLDFFVMTSSISATLGNPGQSNYSAANSFLDALAWHRNLQGLAATSLVLPMVLDVGVVAENDLLEKKIRRKGMYGIYEREMLRGFELAMMQPIPLKRATASLPDSQMILGVEPAMTAAALAESEVSNVYWYNDARFAHVRFAMADAGSSNGGANSGAAGDFKSTVATAQQQGGDAEAVKAIAEHIMKKCSSILMVPFEAFELTGASVASYGLDSMIGAELRTWLFKALGLEMSFQELLAPTLTFEALAIAVGKSMGVLHTE